MLALRDLLTSTISWSLWAAPSIKPVILPADSKLNISFRLPPVRCLKFVKTVAAFDTVSFNWPPLIDVIVHVLSTSLAISLLLLSESAAIVSKLLTVISPLLLTVLSAAMRTTTSRLLWVRSRVSIPTPASIQPLILDNSLSKINVSAVSRPTRLAKPEKESVVFSVPLLRPVINQELSIRLFAIKVLVLFEFALMDSILLTRRLATAVAPIPTLKSVLTPVRLSWSADEPEPPSIIPVKKEIFSILNTSMYRPPVRLDMPAKRKELFNRPIPWLFTFQVLAEEVLTNVLLVAELPVNSSIRIKLVTPAPLPFMWNCWVTADWDALIVLLPAPPSISPTNWPWEE